MRVVLTGAAGFIGSHLAERYITDGHVVLGIDSVLTGSQRNLKTVSSNTRFSFLERDVSGTWDEIERRVSQESIDLVLHFASPASPVDYLAFPIETMLVNSLGTKNAIEFASRRKARFVFASTSETYGDPLEHPQRESYWGNVNPTGPRSCYDESKRFGEALTAAYRRVRGTDTRIIRIFNTYGPRMRRDDGRVVPNFITQALESKPLTIYGDGSQTRSFCYIDDLVEGIVRCAASTELSGKIVNIGNPEEYTIREFAEIVCEIAGVPLEATACQLPVDDPSRRCPDISRAKAILGWQPRVGLREGLGRTLAYFRANP